MGSKTPPEPPDYTKERAAYAKSTKADRQREAQKYNELVERYNNSIGNLTSRAGSLQSSIRGLNISNDELFGSYQTQLDDLSARFNEVENSRRGTMATPEWSSMEQSAYGPVEVGIPRLLTRADTTGFSSALSSSLSALQALRDQRTAEERRIDDYIGQLSAGYSGYTDQVGRLTMADTAGINSMQTQLASALGQINSFNSLIANEYRPGWQSEYTSKIDQARGQLDGLLSQNRAEQDRIRGFESSINSAYDQYNSRLGGMTIADLSGMEELQRLIDEQQASASRFSSPLPYDFNQELSPLQDLEGRLSGLRGKREAELSRIQAAELAARNGMANIEGQLGSADIYNMGILNSLEGAIKQGRQDITGFSSLLPYDFGDVGTQLEAALGQIGQLRQQREASLGTFGSRASDIIARLNGYDLSNEGGFNSGLGDAQRLASELGRYSGNDLGDERDAIQAAIDRANGRIGELNTERGNIENEARGMLTTAQGSEYTSKAALNALAAELKALTGRSTTYGASQSQDELDAIAALISGERSRLDEEAAAALERQQQEQAAYAAYNPYSGNGFGSYYSSYNPWQGNRGFNPNQLPTSFARQLGVIYA